MPSLGADMDDGTLVEWLVDPGDTVERGDIIAVVETQKGAIEIEIFEDGTISKILAPVGATLPVGAPLAIIDGASDEQTPAAPSPKTPEPAPAPQPSAPVAPPPTLVAPTTGERRLISPLARRRAAETGIDLTSVTGTGPNGAITARDLEDISAPPRVKKPSKQGLDPVEMRKAIAAAMQRAQRDIPHYYVSQSIDVSRLTDWLQSWNEERPPQDRLLSTVPLLKATALALRKTPELNGRYENEAFQPSDHVHLGVAVALRGGGLIAPAIHSLDTLALPEVMTQLRDLVARVRSGRLRSSEMMDPTITVTNLGEGHAESVSPIIYPPQVAIVGFGSVSERPWVVDGDVVARPVLTATVGADHRVSDGRLGSKFLCTLREILQDPESL